MAKKSTETKIVLILSRDGIERLYDDRDPVAAERALLLLAHLVLSLDNLKEATRTAFEELDAEESLRSAV